MKNVLIISPTQDINAAAINWGLSRCGHNSTWLKSASLADPALGSTSIILDDVRPAYAKGMLHPERVSSVLYRWPRAPKIIPDAHPGDLTFLSGEWREYESNVYALSRDLTKCLWVNAPDAARNAESKLVQLQTARECGLHHPETLVTTNPTDVRAFLREHRKIIYKPFIMHTWKIAGSDRMMQIPATLIENEARLSDDSIQMCPGIYQRYIEKSADVRVTIIGSQIYAVEMRRNDLAPYVDWRMHVDETGFRAREIALGDDLQHRLQELMARLQIVYGALDLVTTAAGESYFLEVNQAGQSLFVERWQPSIPILASLCAMLATGDTSFTLKSFGSISYRDFLASDAYRIWRPQADRQQDTETERSAAMSTE